MIKTIKAELNDISPLRLDYLKSLPEFQELYLEMFIDNSEYFLIELNNTSIGYAIKTEDDILIEFYLADRYIPMGSTIFQTILRELAIDTIYCKSFDFLLLNYCLTNNYPYRIIGTLFRDYVDSEKFEIHNLSVRFAENQDYSFLLEQEGELYESPEELQKFIKGNNVIMFQKDNQLLGCGYLIKVHANYDYYDIGMWVNPIHRKQGVASMIISHLKQVCLKNNWKPICGCAVENVASQKTLEKNGFVSKHKLIEFKTNDSLQQD